MAFRFWLMMKRSRFKPENLVVKHRMYLRQSIMFVTMMRLKEKEKIAKREVHAYFC